MLMSLSMEVVFDRMMLDAVCNAFVCFSAKHVRLVEAEQMPLSPFSQT